MKLVAWFLSVVISGMVISCFDPPSFPITPEIGFESIDFIDVKDPSPFEVAADSLILRLSFRDGDGDLGIASFENRPPFNDRWYYLTSGIPECDDNPQDAVNRCYGIKVSELTTGKYINYRMKRTGGPAADSLKAFVRPYNCTRWHVISDNTGKVIDTLYFQLNPHYNNIFVEIQIKGSNGDYSVFDWSTFLTYPSCEVQGFNGRYPILKDEDQVGDAPLAGVIRYSMPSPFFKTIFGANTLRLRVFIEDRAFNKSNEIITPDFTLQQKK